MQHIQQQSTLLMPCCHNTPIHPALDCQSKPIILGIGNLPGSAGDCDWSVCIIAFENRRCDCWRRLESCASLVSIARVMTHKDA